MKKIRRKLSQNEITIMRLNGVLTGVTQYLKEKGMLEDCQAWFKVQLKGGDDNGLQGNGEEGSCCKEGKEISG